MGFNVTRSLIFLAALLVASVADLRATAPTLYSQPAYESPVRGDPDELLLLAGDGVSSSDRVVYVMLRDSRSGASPPALSEVPAHPSAALGFAEIVSAAGAPSSLSVRLPAEIEADQPYALWIVNSRGEWSNSVRINDSRPLWVSPDYVYATQSVANLPRLLKVVGRNLQPIEQSRTQVRLTGPRTYTLDALPSSPTLARHVATVTLPAAIEPGRYRVQISRDGASWVGLLGEHGHEPRTVTVLADAAALPAIAVRDFDCDAEDDTSCVVRAVAAAGDRRKFPNGATVRFEARTYKLHNPGAWSDSNESSKHVDFQGIWIPKGVRLQGEGIGSTIVERGTGWVTTRFVPAGRTAPIVSLFNLQGDNTVEGFSFSDVNIYSGARSTSAALSLGIDAHYARNISLREPRLSNVIISRNEFRTPYVAILGQGLPIDHLFITYNTVGAYENGLYINRWGNTVASNPFDMTDSVVAHNVFQPSSYAGVIASQLGGGTRLDFSDNTADGSAARFLYNPADPRGFRAAFFWNLSVNSELKLISNNKVLCAGDKPGDGEAIVFDGADERAYGGFERAAPVRSASGARGSGSRSSTVVVDTKPLTGPLSFVGQWLQVVRGPGRGQLRKITAYASDERTATFTVEPPFDVLPRTDSTVTVGLQNWQSYIVDNVVDQSPGTCVNGPKAAPTAGSISFYAQTADSVIAGNQQTGTSGISLTHQYILHPGEPAFLMLQSANEVRDNRIEGAAAFAGLRSASGIRTFYVVTPEPRGIPEPPLLNFGVTIAGNRLNGASDESGGITFEDGGPVGFLNARGGCSANWELAAAPLIFHNELKNSRGIGINGRESPQHPATCRGSVRDSVVWNATLYGNLCSGAPGVAESCESRPK